MLYSIINDKFSIEHLLCLGENDVYTEQILIEKVVLINIIVVSQSDAL